MEMVWKPNSIIAELIWTFYFAYGDNDAYFIVGQPDNVNVIAGILLANASDAVKLKTVPLIIPEEVDEAIKKTMDWRPPGQ